MEIAYEIDPLKAAPYLVPKQSVEELKKLAGGCYRDKEYKLAVKYYTDCLIQEENFQYFWYIFNFFYFSITITIFSSFCEGIAVCVIQS
jgi:hypothetical protein